MRVKEDKAGIKTKCPKCGTPLTVPKAASNTPAKPAAAADDDDDDSSGYNLSEAFDAPPPSEDLKRAQRADDEEEDEEDEEKPKEKKPKVTRKKLKKRTVQFAEQWQKAQVAVVLVFVGACLWGLNWLLHAIIMMLGLFESPMYSSVALRASESGPLERVTLAIGLMAGLDHLSLGKTLFLIEQILNLAAAGLFLAAFCICLAVPARYGTRGNAVALVCLGTINLLFDLILKLLPAAGAMAYTMVPLLVPEIVMSEADIERSVPLHAFWCGSPFWEVFGAIVIQSAYFFEPILFCIFLRAVAISLKDDEWLEPQALGLIRLGFGQLFILLSFYLLSITGTSEVLHLVLLLAYVLWRGFLLGFIVNFASTVWKTRARIAYLLGTEEEEDDDD